MPNMLEAFWIRLERWSVKAFGPDNWRGPQGPLEHLAKEVEEVKAKPGDIMEYVDCFHLVLDATRRAGFSYQQFEDALFLKISINEKRSWPPVDMSVPCDNRAKEHDRTLD